MEKEEKRKQGFAVRPDLINKNGRPKKGKTLTDLLVKYGKQRQYLDKETGRLISRKDGVIKELWDLAINAKDERVKLAAIQYIYDRFDGKMEKTINSKSEDQIYVIKPNIMRHAEKIKAVDAEKVENNDR